MATLVATAASALAKAGPLLKVGGTILSTVGALNAGAAQKAAADHQAVQLDQQAKTEKALAQREAQERRREKEFAISRARAVAGSDQDLDLLGDIEEEGELRAQYAIWEGDERAKGRRAQAAASRFEGRQRKRASVLDAGSTLLDGGTSFLEKYG